MATPKPTAPLTIFYDGGCPPHAPVTHAEHVHDFLFHRTDLVDDAGAAAEPAAGADGGALCLPPPKAPGRCDIGSFGDARRLLITSGPADVDGSAPPPPPPPTMPLRRPEPPEPEPPAAVAAAAAVRSAAPAAAHGGGLGLSGSSSSISR